MIDNYNRRKHSLTSFYVKTVHSHPTPIKRIQMGDDHIKEEALQSLIRMQQKEIERLEHQNKNLQMLSKYQSTMLYQERVVRTRSIKSLIDTPLRNIESPMKQSSRAPKLDTIESKPQPTRMRKKSQLSKKLTQMFQQDDTMKLNVVLSQNTSEAEGIQQYASDGSILLLNEILNEEDSFIDLMTNYPPQQVSIVYDKLKKMFQEHATMFQLVLKLKSMIMTTFAISKSKILDDATQLLIKSAQSNLECGAVTIYLLDEDKKQLYSPQNNKRFNIGEGIVGYVAETMELLNLKNAKHDTRFKELDLKTVLACPIIDNNKCYGVIICLDKNDGQFQLEDESLVHLISMQARMIMNNVLSHDQLILSINKLRHSLQSSILLLQNIDSIDNLVDVASSRLKALTNSDYATVKLLKNINNQGIMGQAVSKQQVIQVSNAYNNPHYHPDVDIKTNLPVVAIPLSDDGVSYGALEFTTIKGAMQSSLSSIEMEVLLLYSKCIAQCIKQSQIIHG